MVEKDIEGHKAVVRSPRPGMEGYTVIELFTMVFIAGVLAGSVTLFYYLLMALMRVAGS